MPVPTPAQNAWTTGLCDCCAEPGKCGLCCYVLCCPCCAYGSNVERMPPTVCCGGSCAGACLAFTGMTFLGCPCILTTMTRGYVREKYGIPGDCFTDFMASWCCGACALCQMGRELSIRGAGKGGVELVPAAAVDGPRKDKNGLLQRTAA